MLRSRRACPCPQPECPPGGGGEAPLRGRTRPLTLSHRFRAVNTRQPRPHYAARERFHRLPEEANTYSITSSARERSEGGMVRPSAVAALRLITSSNLVGC